MLRNIAQFFLIMVTTCVVFGCDSKSTGTNKSNNEKEEKAGDNKEVSFFYFPKDNERRKLWISKLKFKKSNFVPKNHSRVCSKHFVEKDYHYNDVRPKLNQHAVPQEYVTEKTTSDEATAEPPIKKQRPNPSMGSLPTPSSPTKDDLMRAVKTLKQKVKRKEKRIKHFKSIIKTMKKEKLINKSTMKLITENFQGITKELVQSQLNNQNRKNFGRRYSDDIKKFALTLHFYSPRAYEFVQQYLTLPNERSLAYWTSSVECEPGLFKDVFDYLEMKGEKDANYKDCCLILDGIHIKSGLVYNPSTGVFEGYVNYGENIVIADSDKEATEALVFMLVGLRGQWKCPIGYVLINGITGNNLHIILSRFMKSTLDHNVRIHGVTADGTSVNFDCMKKFGCKLSGTSLDLLSGEFTFMGYVMFFTPDACHMLKLARNALAEIKVIKDVDGDIIKWEHIQELQKVQEQEGLKFANKLSKGHVQYQRRKMNVKLAAQTLSSSVADSLEYLMNVGHESLKDAHGTIRFLRVIDRIFDLLNSRSAFAKGFKRPLSLSDQSIWTSTIKKTAEYLKGLTTVDGQKLLTHARKTFIIGLTVCARSIEKIAIRLLTRAVDPFRFILTYKFSQDHLELLFGCIRGKNGFNSNPDVRMFKSSMKRILLRNSIVASKYSNCASFQDEGCSSIFSLKWNKRSSPLNETDSIDEELFTDIGKDLVASIELSSYKEAILGYIAGCIVRKMSKKLTCSACYDSLRCPCLPVIHDHNYSSATIDVSFISSKNRGGLTTPSQSVIHIVKVAERYIRVALLNPRKINKKVLAHSIFMETSGQNLFSDLSEHDKLNDAGSEDLHSTQLMKRIIDYQIKIRLYSYVPLHNKDKLHKDDIGKRQQATKSLIFQGL